MSEKAPNKIVAVAQTGDLFTNTVKIIIQRVLGVCGYGVHRTKTLEALHQQLRDHEARMPNQDRMLEPSPAIIETDDVSNLRQRIAKLEACIGSLEEKSNLHSREARFRHHIQVNMIRYFVQGRRDPWLSIDPLNVEYQGLDVDKILAHPLIEPDFSIFSCFDDPSETILDLGANTGLAASSIFQSGCKASILSFEPNPLHHKVLAQLREHWSGRFDFVPFGLSSSQASLRFYTPVIEGRGLDPLTTAAPMAALDWGIPENVLIHCMQHLPHISEPRIQFCEQEWRVDTLDDLLKHGRFKVSIDRIVGLKFDLEGHESDAIKGARETIAQHTPLIMIEEANRVEAIDSFLRAMGYLYADFCDGHLVITENASPRVNGFYLHAGKLDTYAAKSLFDPAKRKFGSGAISL